MAFLLGGLAMTIYGLVISYINDHLRADQFVAASSAMLFMNGFGAIIGPMLATQLMTHLGVNVYFPTLSDHVRGDLRVHPVPHDRSRRDHRRHSRRSTRREDRLFTVFDAALDGADQARVRMRK